MNCWNLSNHFYTSCLFLGFIQQKTSKAPQTGGSWHRFLCLSQRLSVSPGPPQGLQDGRIGCRPQTSASVGSSDPTVRGSRTAAARGEPREASEVVAGFSTWKLQRDLNDLPVFVVGGSFWRVASIVLGTCFGFWRLGAEIRSGQLFAWWMAARSNAWCLWQCLLARAFWQLSDGHYDLCPLWQQGWLRGSHRKVSFYSWAGVLWKKRWLFVVWGGLEKRCLVVVVRGNSPICFV